MEEVHGVDGIAICSGLETTAIIRTEVLSRAADDDIGSPLSWLIEEIFRVQVGAELTFIVAVANYNKLTVFFGFPDFFRREIMNLKLFADHVVVGFVDRGQVDEERNGSSRLVNLPKAIF